MAGGRFDVVVVGSLNQDLVATVPRIPAPGETVLASGHAAFAGGKGANQATAAARLGANVAMVGRVGADANGSTLREGLAGDGIDVSRVLIDDEAATGLALINVDAAGENAITVSPGANGAVTAADVTAATDLLEVAAVVLLQLEVPIEAVSAAAELARGIVILNPAPAAELPTGLLENVDILVPNESELASLAGAHTATEDEVAAAARSLPVSEVVVTLGARGALVVSKSGIKHVPPVPVDPVDTTGAGDAFCGALAAELARGSYVQAAARFAAKVAAHAVTKHGAQASMPTRDELT
ncbi:MAG: ribokinase [Acidimicrobiia bacterium]|nr:ribokinase [Acidimicrobiia bacterium]